MSIELCHCCGAVCAHGTCTRCQNCTHCGPSGRTYYEDRMERTGGSLRDREDELEEERRSASTERYWQEKQGDEYGSY